MLFLYARCARAKGSGQSKADFSSFVMRLFYDDIVLFYFPHEKKRTVSWVLWIVESVSMITLMMLEITLYVTDRRSLVRIRLENAKCK